MLFNKRCLSNKVLNKNITQLEITMKISAKLLSIKLLKLSSSSQDPFLTQLHIFVSGPCHLLTDNFQKSSSKKQSVEVSKVLMPSLSSLVCSCGSTLLWVSSWVWIPCNVSYTLYVFNGSNSKTNFSRLMDGNSLH